MLSRRHIRIKVLQALYQAQQSETTDLSSGERKMVSSIESIYELYLYEMSIIFQLRRLAEEKMERNKQKHLAGDLDKNPNLRFVNNAFILWLENNLHFNKLIEEYHIKWGDDRELINTIWKQIEASEEFDEYMSSPENSVLDDRRFVKLIYGKYISVNEDIHHFYEERDMHWADDLDAAQMIVAKTIKSFKVDADEFVRLPKLLKESDDMEFAKTLYKKARAYDTEFDEIIKEKAKNWEIERIALLDILLMRMAITEMIEFKEIPVKVTMNEYIELSKEYSTPKSSTFINGIVDKIRIDFEKSKRIKKIGRGLL